MEQQPHDDLEHHRAAPGGERRAGAEPLGGAVAAGALGGDVALPQRRHRVGRRRAPDDVGLHVVDAVDLAGAAAAEDERRDARRRDEQHRDLAHRVPRADVDERDVDDVLATAELDRLGREVLRDGGVDARAGDDEREARDGDPDGEADGEAHPPAAGERPVGEVRGEAAQHEDEDDERDGLDEHLGEGEVGGAVQQEDAGDRVPGEAQEDDGFEATTRAGREDRGEDGRRAEHGLRRLVPRSRALRGCRPEQQRDPDDDDEHDEDEAEVHGERTTLGERGDVRGEVVELAHEPPVDDVGLGPRRRGRARSRDLGAEPEEQRAEREDEQREPEDGGEPAPQREVPGLAARVGGGVRGEEVLAEVGHERGGEAERRERERGPDQDERGARDRGRALGHLRVVRVDGREAGELPLGREGPPREAQAVADGERRAEDDRHEDGRRVEAAVVPQRLEGGLLRDVAREGRQADHRGRREQSRDGRDGKLASDAGEPTQVAGAGRGVDDADDEEQRRLEHRVGAEHREARERRRARVVADEQDEQPELRHGPVGEDELEVVLAQRPVATDEQRDRPEGQDDRLPCGQVRVPGGEARDEVDAGLDHRGGVEVRGHGRRGGHGCGQPEVDGDERGLRHGADEEEDDRDVHARADGRVGEDLRDPVGARGLAEHDHPDEHREPARGGEDDRLHRRTPRRLAVRVVPDEQVGEDGRQLPEGVEQDEVVGCDEAEHRAREAREDSAEPTQPARGGLEVGGAVDEHERTHATDDERHEPGERVEAERQLEPEAGDPLDDLKRAVPTLDARREARGPYRGGRGREGEDEECATSEPADEDRCEQRHDRVRDQQHEHVCSVLVGGWAEGASVEMTGGARTRASR